MIVPWWGFALGAAVFATLFSILEKKGVKKEHAMEYELTRTSFVALFSLFLIPWLSFSYGWKSILITYFVSFLAAIGILFRTKSIRHAEISEITPLLNLTPGFLAILAFFFLGEILNKFQILGIVLLIVGAYVLETDHNSLWKSFLKHLRSKYVDYVIFASFIFSVTALFNKFVLDYYLKAFDYMFLVWIFTSINFIIFSTIKYNGIKGMKHCLKISRWNVVLAGLFSFFSNLFTLIAMSFAYVALVVPIERLSGLFTTVIGGEMFHEHGVVKKSIACLVMIGGACLIILL